MAFEITKESYTGSIKAITLGKGDKAVVVGGETCYPFYTFEGEMPHVPKIAMEVWDMAPTEWPAAAQEPFKDVLSDPVAWARKCIDDYGAEIIVLQLKSTDPNGMDVGPDEAAALVKKVLDAIDVPLIVWGTANVQKDEAVLKKIADVCQDRNLIIGPVEDKNHKGIGASALGFGHTVIASSPIDVNLAKQVNILLENLGMPMDRMLIDPTTGGLGYGLEYSYSVMERLRMAALTQGDDKLQLPIVNNIANEVWKCKEAKQPVEEDPILGDPERRAVMMEALTAVAYLLSGSDILIMRHPEAIRMAQNFISLALNGGSAVDVPPIQKQLEETAVDLAALAPEPDLTIAVEKPKPAAKKAPPAEAKPAPAPAAAEPAKAAPAAPATAEPVKAEPAPAAAAKAAEKAEAPDAAKIAAEEKARAEAAAAQREAEARARAEAEAKAKARAEAEAKAKAQAEAEARARAEEEKRLKTQEAEEKLRQKVAADRSRREAGGKHEPAVELQKDRLAKMLGMLNHIHKRAA